MMAMSVRSPNSLLSRGVGGTRVEASAGGGMVTVKMTGDREVKEVRIDPGALGDDVSAEDLAVRRCFGI